MSAANFVFARHCLLFDHKRVNKQKKQFVVVEVQLALFLEGNIAYKQTDKLMTCRAEEEEEATKSL